MEWIPTPGKKVELNQALSADVARTGVKEAIELVAELRKQYPDMRISHQSRIINYIKKYKVSKP